MTENDLISRKALLVRLAHHHAHSYGNVERAYGVAVEEVLNAPAVDAEPKWISVKARLPEAEGDYLVCSEFANIRSLKIMTFALNLESVDEYCFAGEKRPGWWDFDGETGNYEWSHVTHWMPLPELPREDEV